MSVSAVEAEVVYPESDGKPMGDNSHQLDLMITLYQWLSDRFAGRPDVAVHTNLNWYPVKGRADVCRAPDVMVAFGRPPGRRGSYKQWEEGGVAPQVVFEIYAPGNTPKDLLDKFFFYERYGVEEYYFFDPDAPALSGWRRADGEWTEIDPVHGFVSPRLGVRFHWAGGDRFELHDPSAPLPTHADLRRALEDERRRADRLAAELRKLGVDPDRLDGTGGTP